MIGGRTVETEFNARVLVFDLQTQTWADASAMDHRIAQVAGHVAVYHAGSSSIFVIGGFVPASIYWSSRTNAIRRFSTMSRTWHEMDAMGMPYPSLVFSAGALYGTDTILLFGGNRHVHDYDESCYEQHLWAYHVLCGIVHRVPQFSVRELCCTSQSVDYAQHTGNRTRDSDVQ